jgi:hypothetical protein
MQNPVITNALKRAHKIWDPIIIHNFVYLQTHVNLLNTWRVQLQMIVNHAMPVAVQAVMVLVSITV